MTRLTPTLIAAMLASLAGLAVSQPEAVEAAAPPSGAFEPLDGPCRSLDTRDNASPVRAGGTITDDLTDCGVPRDALAVAISVTSVRPEGDGHLTVWPSGESKPNTSTVNYTRFDRAVANAAWVGVANGRIDIASHAKSHVLVDVTGYWTEVPPGEETAGRIKMLKKPTRAVDTRENFYANGWAGYDAYGRATYGYSEVSRLLSLDGRDMSAVIVNVTLVGGFGPSFATVWGTDAGHTPDTSVVNVDGKGVRASGAVIVPIDSWGTLHFTRTEWAADVIIDVVGYVDANVTDSPDGLFVPTSPRRLLDSRGGSMIGTDGFASIVTAEETAGALVGNTTLVPHRSSHATVTQPGPAGEISTVNAASDAAAANTVTRLGDLPDGRGVARATMGAGLGYLIFDSTGYVTGSRAGTYSGDLENRRTPDRRGAKTQRPVGHLGDQDLIHNHVIPCLESPIGVMGALGSLEAWHWLSDRGIVWLREPAVADDVGGVAREPVDPMEPVIVFVDDDNQCEEYLHSMVHAIDYRLGVSARNPTMCGDRFVTAEGLALAAEIVLLGKVWSNRFYTLPEFRECADRADVQARAAQMWHEFR